ncbi:MAG TPA: hypothetical protein VGH03_08630 [Caulobacteraceae bacterium]
MVQRQKVWADPAIREVLILQSSFAMFGIDVRRDWGTSDRAEAGVLT